MWIIRVRLGFGVRRRLGSCTRHMSGRQMYIYTNALYYTNTTRSVPTCNSQARLHEISTSKHQTANTATYSKVPGIPGTRVYISPGSPPGRLARCLKGAPHRVRDREPRLGAVHNFLCISPGSMWMLCRASGPVLHQVH